MGAPADPVRHILSVCRTCHRYAARVPGEPTPGERLADRIDTLLSAGELAGELGERMTLRRVECLSGCRNPCTVSLGATAKTRLRLSRLDPDDAERILRLARAYADSPAGDVPDALRAIGLAGHVTSVIPPRPGP